MLVLFEWLQRVCRVFASLELFLSFSNQFREAKKTKEQKIRKRKSDCFECLVNGPSDENRTDSPEDP